MGLITEWLFGSNNDFKHYLVKNIADDLSEARRLDEESKKIYNEAKEKLESMRNRTNSHLESLGKLKFYIYEKSLTDFVEIYSKIKNIDFQDILQLELLPSLDEKDVLRIKESVTKEDIKDVSNFIIDLAHNSLNSLVLSSGENIFCNTMTLIRSQKILSKAKKAKYNAYENHKNTKTAAEQMDGACVVLDGIYKRVDEFIDILEPLNNYLYQLNNQMNIIINNNTNWFQKLLRASYKKFKESDKKIIIIATIVETAWFQKLLKTNYQKFKESDKKKIMTTIAIAQTVKNLCDVPIIDENGEVTKQSETLLEDIKKLTQKISEV